MQHHQYLVMLNVPETHEGILEGLVQTAASFLGTSGPVERAEIGSFRRTGRSTSPEEVLRLVRFSANAAADNTKARMLEGVLRSTISAADAKGGEARVFIAAGDARGEG